LSKTARRIPIGAEVILLDGPEFVFLPSHDANRIALGEFWRSLSYSDLEDHQMEKYLRRIAAKANGAKEVPYTGREKYVVAGVGESTSRGVVFSH
jgi:triacylglycerol lipase